MVRISTTSLVAIRSSDPFAKLLQAHLQLPERRVQPALYGTQRQIERVRYFLERKFLEFFHHHNLSQVRRQGANRSSDCHASFSAFSRPRRRNLCRQSKDGRILFGFILERRLAPHLRASLPRDALIDGDPMQPRRNLRFAAKAAQIPKRGHESLLRRIARLFFAAEHPKSQREDASLPPTHDLPNPLRIPRHAPFHPLL